MVPLHKRSLNEKVEQRKKQNRTGGLLPCAGWDYHDPGFGFACPEVTSGLWQVASRVSKSYDALLKLFDSIGNFLKRLEIFTRIPPTPLMTDTIMNIMTELLSVLGLATKLIKQGRVCGCTSTYPSLVAQFVIVMFAKKLLGENDVEDALDRFDRSTQEEGRMATTQILSVVYRLESDVRLSWNVRGIYSVVDDLLLSAGSIR